MSRSLLALLVLTALASCKTYEQSGGLRWNAGFEEDAYRLPMDAFVVRLPNDSALLVVKFFGTERNRNTKWKDSIRFTFKVFIDTTGGTVFNYRDSTSVVLPALAFNTEQDAATVARFKAPSNMRWLMVQAESGDPAMRYKRNVEIQSQNNFAPLVTDSAGVPINPLHLHAGESYRVHALQNVLTLQHFAYPPRPAPPVYRVNDPVPERTLSDTTLVVDFSNTVRFTEPGMYRVRDSVRDASFVLCVHDGFYPEVKTPNELIAPLRYITRNEEYNKMYEASDPKAAIDSFWMSRARSEAVARRSIRIYYNRVEEANRLFSCHQPGWMTDRGMALIIYGTPDRAFKFKEGEIWSYSTNFVRPVEFVFVRKEGFAGVDYELRRMPEYLQSWNQQSFKWRTGGILNDVPQLY
ncbi:MAG TPA: GWxTD domain-containing protein [Chitinophagales bacterium]|nr:GWxTD domain-containing protein [Chitinophagales bacterium]